MPRSLYDELYGYDLVLFMVSLDTCSWWNLRHTILFSLDSLLSLLSLFIGDRRIIQGILLVNLKLVCSRWLGCPTITSNAPIMH